MVFGTLFGFGPAKGAANPETDADQNSGYFRLAFPAWSIPGVRVVREDLVVEQTSRSEIESLFSLDLRRARLGARLSPSEISDLEASRSLRRALYEDRIAA